MPALATMKLSAMRAHLEIVARSITRVRAAAVLTASVSISPHVKAWALARNALPRRSAILAVAMKTPALKLKSATAKENCL